MQFKYKKQNLSWTNFDTNILYLHNGTCWRGGTPLGELALLAAPGGPGVPLTAMGPTELGLLGAGGGRDEGLSLLVEEGVEGRLEGGRRLSELCVYNNYYTTINYNYYLLVPLLQQLLLV